MRPRTVLGLAAAVVILLVFIWLYERRLPSTDQAAEKAKRVLQLAREEITAIEIDRQGKRVYLERQDGSKAEVDTVPVETSGWTILEPLSATADSNRIEDLLAALTSLEKRRTLENADFAQLGLDRPKVRVTLHRPGGQTVLLVGDKIPASTFVVVALPDRSEAFVVEDTFWADLSREPGEWRSRKVFSDGRDDIVRITLEWGGYRLLLARRDDRFWIEAPLSDRADEARVTELLSALTTLTVSRFVDAPEAPLSEMGLDPPAGTVEAVVEGKTEPFRVEWGGPVGESADRFYARSREMLFETESLLREVVARSSEDWRSRKLASLKPFEIDRVTVIDPEQGELRLERAGADWLRQGEEISFTSVSELLYSLTDLAATRLLDAAEVESLDLSLDEPRLEFVLEGSERRESLSLYGELENGVPARASGRSVCLLIDREASEQLSEKLSAVRAAPAQGTEPLTENEAPSDPASPIG